MTRDELHDVIDWLDSMGVNVGYRAAAFLRQIADAKPAAWAATDETGKIAEALGMNQSRRFDTALYILPLED